LGTQGEANSILAHIIRVTLLDDFDFTMAPPKKKARRAVAKADAAEEQSSSVLTDFRTCWMIKYVYLLHPSVEKSYTLLSLKFDRLT
jgi:hypothetical protein